MSVKKLNAIAGAYNSVHKDMADKKAAVKKKKLPKAVDPEMGESPEFEAAEDEAPKKKGKM